MVEYDLSGASITRDKRTLEIVSRGRWRECRVEVDETQIGAVALCTNGMVMVFNVRGGQLPQFQGAYAEVKEAILRAAPAHTVFWLWDYPAREVRALTRDEFAADPRRA